MSGQSGVLSSRLMFGDGRLANWREGINGILGLFRYMGALETVILVALMTIGFGISGSELSPIVPWASCVWLTVSLRVARPSSVNAGRCSFPDAACWARGASCYSEGGCL